MQMRNWLNTVLVVAAVTAVGCGPGRLAYNAPPAQRLMEPGPGVGGPGPGVIPAGNQMTRGGPTGPARNYGPGGNMGGGCSTGACVAMDDASFTSAGPSKNSSIQQVQYCDAGAGGGGGMPMMPPTSQIAFLGEEALQIQWSVSGGAHFDSSPLMVPGRQDFPQGALYRLKVSNIPGRAAVSLYPTLEIAPVTPRTDAYLAHAPIPVQFTEEDFDQVLSGNFVTKVIYLPDPEFQELALAGVETLVSTRLDPGCDPVSEADKRGSILAILRIGNKDLEAGSGMQAGIIPASYGEGEMVYEDGGYEGGYSEGGYEGGGCQDGSCGVGPQAAMGPSPMGGPAGMPAMARPQAMPPHMMAGAPQWGMPITGTPIGLPGPPHIPLGHGAGLQKHVMKNRTRVLLPPPTPEVTISVKQRPGMNYPAPVNHIKVDETRRAPFRPFGGTVPLKAGQSMGNCNDCQ